MITMLGSEKLVDARQLLTIAVGGDGLTRLEKLVVNDTMDSPPDTKKNFLGMKVWLWLGSDLCGAVSPLTVMDDVVEWNPRLITRNDFVQMSHSTEAVEIRFAIFLTLATISISERVRHKSAFDPMQVETLERGENCHMRAFEEFGNVTRRHSSVFLTVVKNGLIVQDMRATRARMVTHAAISAAKASVPLVDGGSMQHQLITIDLLKTSEGGTGGETFVEVALKNIALVLLRSQHNCKQEKQK